jgi:hypothetical protein
MLRSVDDLPVFSTRSDTEFWLWRKPVFEDMIAPPAPFLPPLEAGVNVMPRYYLYKTSPAFFEKQVIRHYRNRGAPAGGRSPRSVKQLPMISPEQEFFIGIIIAIEIRFRINRTLISAFPSNPDEKIFSRP